MVLTTEATKRAIILNECLITRGAIHHQIGRLVSAINRRITPIEVLDFLRVIEISFQLDINDTFNHCTLENSPEMYATLDELAGVLCEIFNVQALWPEVETVAEAISIIAHLINSGELVRDKEIFVDIINCENLFEAIKAIEDDERRRETIARLEEAIKKAVETLIIN